MLGTQMKLQVVDGVLEGGFDDTEHWPPIGSALPDVKLGALRLGDPDSGPVVAMICAPPGVFDGIPLPPPEDLLHHHRTDTFRIAVGDQPNQIKDAGRWLGRGDYLLMAANQIYTEEFGSDGTNLFLVDADRRGSEPQLEKRSVEEALRQANEELNSAMFGDGNVPSYYTRDEDAVLGMASTHAAITSKRKLFGKMSDDVEWARLADGSTIAAIFMGDQAYGPMILLSNNAPGAVEAPAGRYVSDTVRLVLKGSCTVGDRTYGPQQFRATEAGAAEGQVVHGPEGSTQLIVFADRRGWLPETEAAGAYVTPRLAEVAAVLAPFVETAATLAAKAPAR